MTLPYPNLALPIPNLSYVPRTNPYLIPVEVRQQLFNWRRAQEQQLLDATAWLDLCDLHQPTQGHQRRGLRRSESRQRLFENNFYKDNGLYAL